MDKDKLEKIILNLLFNSFKFTPEGGKVTMKADLEGKWLTVTIADTGKGIAEVTSPGCSIGFGRLGLGHPPVSGRGDRACAREGIGRGPWGLGFCQKRKQSECRNHHPSCDRRLRL